MEFFTKRLRDEDRGFTLIELMVVVLIIAILIAIAIPTFLGARKRAQDRAAQTSLRSALQTAKGVYTDNETYLTGAGGTAMPKTTMTAAEPSLTYTDPAADANSTGPKVVAYHIPSQHVFSAAVRSVTGVCWQIYDNSNTGPTRYGRMGAVIATADSCSPPTAAQAAADPFSSDTFPPAP